MGNGCLVQVLLWHARDGDHEHDADGLVLVPEDAHVAPGEQEQLGVGEDHHEGGQEEGDAGRDQRVHRVQVQAALVGAATGVVVAINTPSCIQPSHQRA